MDDWMIAVLGLTILFAGILGYILKTWRDIARLEGHLDSIKKDISLLRDESESVRVRLRDVEIKNKKEPRV